MEIIKGDILLNLKEIENGEKYELFSLREDLFLNQKVEVYELVMEKDTYYIIARKNISLNETIVTKEKVNKFLVNQQSIDKYEKMELTESEIGVLLNNSNECFLIKEEWDLNGIYENGVEFNYPCIIKVNKTE